MPKHKPGSDDLDWKEYWPDFIWADQPGLEGPLSRLMEFSLRGTPPGGVAYKFVPESILGELEKQVKAGKATGPQGPSLAWAQINIAHDSHRRLRSLAFSTLARTQSLIRASRDCAGSGSALGFMTCLRSAMENAVQAMEVERQATRALKEAANPGEVVVKVKELVQRLLGTRTDWMTLVGRDGSTQTLEKSELPYKQREGRGNQAAINILTAIEHAARVVPEALTAYSIFSDICHPNIGADWGVRWGAGRATDSLGLPWQRGSYSAYEPSTFLFLAESAGDVTVYLLGCVADLVDAAKESASMTNALADQTRDAAKTFLRPVVQAHLNGLPRKATCPCGGGQEGRRCCLRPE